MKNRKGFTYIQNVLNSFILTLAFVAVLTCSMATETFLYSLDKNDNLINESINLIESLKESVSKGEDISGEVKTKSLKAFITKEFIYDAEFYTAVIKPINKTVVISTIGTDYE